jgi:large subunit ribosomal protein L15
VSLNDITSVDTGRQVRKRVGRGIGSGLGKTAGRGSKGEGARTGGKNRGPLFEGGQFPFWMRLPKRGFSNHGHRVVFQTVDLARALARVSGKEISLATLIKAGLANTGEAVKLVGKAEVKGKYTVTVNRVSASVRSAIEAAGGSVVESDRGVSDAKPGTKSEAKPTDKKPAGK